MTEVSKHAPGTFSWVDLSTTDAGAAKKFYTALFGWGAIDMPAGEAGIYTMLQLEGKEVAGMSQMSEEQQAQGMPPHWLSYITVARVNKSAEKVKSLGGTMLMEPFDVLDAGRMGLVQDPTGAVFAMWEPRNHIGARLVNQPGALCWTELATRDTDKAGAFYTRLFGWGTQVQEMGSTRYTIFLNGEQQSGGLFQMPEEWGDIPPHWMVYFAVEDCDASTGKAKELGGEVKVPPTDIPSVGRFAVLQDPQGGAFSIIKLASTN